jgi:hypothetical protein
MPSHSQVAASVRRAKEEHPERYCAHPACLWFTAVRVDGRVVAGAKWCPRHGTTSKRRESECDPDVPA